MIDSRIWEKLKYRQGSGLVKEAQELSAVVQALSEGLIIAVTYCRARDKAKRDLEHRERIAKFKRRKQRGV